MFRIHQHRPPLKRRIVAAVASALLASSAVVVVSTQAQAVDWCSWKIEINSNLVKATNSGGTYGKCYRIQAQGTRVYQGGSTTVITGPITANSSNVHRESALSLIERRGRAMVVQGKWAIWTPYLTSDKNIHSWVS